MHTRKTPIHTDSRGTATEHTIVVIAVALMGITGLGILGQGVRDSITSGATTQRGNSPAASMAVSSQAGLGEAARLVVRGVADTAEWFHGKARPNAPMAEFWLPPTMKSVEPLAAGVPSRFVVTHGAREMHGALLDRIADGLTQGDPLADAVIKGMHEAGMNKEAMNGLIAQVIETRRVPKNAPASVQGPLQAFLDQVNTVPEWVNREQLNAGADVMVRSGAAGLTTLIAYSLPLTYTSPAGVKPLVWTKDLLEATPRRLAETMCFVNQTCARDALLPGGEAWKATVRVRLIHATVRGALAHMPNWKPAEWGMPINQTEMAGTNVAFSAVFMDGMKRLGFRYTPQESQAVMDLWRYSGYLTGVDEGLLAKTEAEGRQFVAAISATQAPPDADSQRLISTLLKVSVVPNPPAQLRAVNESLTRYLLGPYYSTALQLPKGGLEDALHLLGPTSAKAWDAFRQRFSLANKASVAGGRALWNRVVDTALGKHPAEFLIPEGGRGVRSADTPLTLGP